jgi:uncharacterized protein DUF4157
MSCMLARKPRPMGARFQIPLRTVSTRSFTPASRGLLQRCCGTEECDDCRSKRPAVQHSSISHGEPSRVPYSVHAVLRSPGQPLESTTRAWMEPRFGRDFSEVRVHTDIRAAESARELNALAYTVGRDVVFGAGQYEGGTISGIRLLAHELAHVAQQLSTSGFQKVSDTSVEIVSSKGQDHERQAEDAARQIDSGESLAGAPLSVRANLLQKAETLGARVNQPKGAKRPHKKISATFDGRDFVMQGDGTELVRAAGQSGRPNTVKPADARSCGGSPDDSYLNNPRYVGIADNGPIPEGEFLFRRSDMVTFTAGEQAKMSLAGESEYVDPSGLALHGDWGAARAPLRPVRIVPAKLCGSTTSRSGFYLHGGVMPGSSGCIDIGNEAVMNVVGALAGYPDPVHVLVKYTQTPPDVGLVERAAGRFMYPPGKNPSLADRFRSLFGGGEQ